MKCYVYDGVSGRLLHTEEREPVCGENFCDTCGDCLACYGSDPCCPDGENRDSHYWVEYQETSAAIGIAVAGQEQSL
jgi:hypothetical protein